MSQTLATYNIKGGVGKTSAAANLAYLAAAGGARTLLWDLDPQGASTRLSRRVGFLAASSARSMWR